jgi:hypothetical protein
MQPQATVQATQRKQRARWSPLRLFDWIDRQESQSKRRVACGVLIAAILALFAFANRQIVAAIPFLERFLSALRTDVRVEIWMLLAGVAVPLLGVMWVYLAHRRRLRRLESSVRFIRDTYMMEPGVAADMARFEQLRKQRKLD